MSLAHGFVPAPAPALRYTCTWSTSMVCGNMVVASGLPGQLPPTATQYTDKDSPLRN